MTGVNITSKKEEKNIFHIKYFYCKKKGHFANKYSQKKNHNVED